MKSIRHTVLGTAAVALSLPFALAHPLAHPLASQADGPTSTSEEVCTCTCAICAAKHGAKAADAELEAELEAELPSTTETSAPAPNLPDAPTDIAAEVARILATDLGDVDDLVASDTLTGVTAAGVAEVTDVQEASTGERGYMGVSLGGSQDDGRATIAGVNPGSPAQGVGLQAGDIIVAVEGMPVKTVDEAIAEVKGMQAGQTVTLEIERGDEELELEMVLAPESMLESQVPASIVEEEEEVEVILPSVERILLQQGTNAAGTPSSGFFFEAGETGTFERKAGVEVEGRWSTTPGTKMGAPDALPEGYVEITTTRERRPAAADEMRRRMAELEREVAELSKLVAELRAELSRRNPH